MLIYVLNALTRDTRRTDFLVLVLQGRLKEALLQVQRNLDGFFDAKQADASAVDLAILCGDLMLAQDRDEEAEGLYRQAIKAACMGERGQVRVISCRNTGFVSLYQQRWGTAVSCFHRLTEDPAATLPQKIEAYGGLAMAHYHTGRIQQALDTLENASELIADYDAAPNTVPSVQLQMFVDVLRAELMTHHVLHAHPMLNDHVFWQSAATWSASPTDASMATSLLSSLKIHLDQYGQYELIEQRLRHLSHLILALDGSKKSLEALISHLGWLRQNSLNAEERQSRLDAAIVALANRHLLIARNMLEPFTARANEHTHKRWSIESSYCLAKLHELNGHAEEAMRHYQRYALQAMQCVRTEISVDQRTANRPSQATPSVSAAKDDVEMSLPAKYRRAYRYLLSHMDCANLSVREIAEHVGVTERALQSVFRRHLGMTPIEVLRRCRVERIREDLLNNEENSLTILEAATRWGIRNRSTLVSSYRKYFSETPTDTLARRGRYSGSSPSLGTLGSSYAQAA